MSRVAVVTDSNSGITQAEGEEMGVYVLPMPFFINEKQYFEDINLTQAQFYRMLAEKAEISTSQPTPADVQKLWDRVLASYDEIVYIPMSSGLSASCDTAKVLAREYGGRVQVVDNQRISVTMKQSVRDALALVGKGLGAKEIRNILQKEARESSIYLMVDTLYYLKKGGRITPAAALLGSALNIKPVLQIQGEKLDAYKKVRGVKHARKVMLDAMRHDLDTRYKARVKEGSLRLFAAYTTRDDEALEWKKEIAAAFPHLPVSYMDPLSLSISCHTGPGVLAIAAAHGLDG